jgi:hypothetical protein
LNDLEHIIVVTNKIIDNLEPRVKKYFRKITKTYGVGISMNVSVDLATSMLAMVLLMAENNGLNKDQVIDFLDSIHKDILEKYKHTIADWETESVILKAKTNHKGYTCRPLD